MDGAAHSTTHGYETDIGGLIAPVSYAMAEPVQVAGVLAVTIDCGASPLDEDDGLGVPVINVQIVDDFWIKDLDPSAAAAFGEELRALGELITGTAAPLLAAVRARPGSEPTPLRRKRKRPSRLHHEPEAVTWAREKAGLTKRALAHAVGISEQLANEIESGWRSATPANLARIAEALNCPVVVLERKRPQRQRPPS